MHELKKKNTVFFIDPLPCFHIENNIYDNIEANIIPYPFWGDN
jgi:hypothetical protein